MGTYQSITPMLGEIVRNKKTGKRYSVNHNTTTINGKPVVWLSGEKRRSRQREMVSKSGYRSVGNVIQNYELVRGME